MPSKYLLFHLLFILLISCISIKDNSCFIGNDEKILVIGDRNTFFGSLFNYGFVKQFQNKTESKAANVSFMNIAVPNIQYEAVLRKLRSEMFDNFQPSKVFFFIEKSNIILKQDSLEYQEQEINRILFNIQSILNFFNHRKVRVFVSLLLIHGERADSSASSTKDTNHDENNPNYNLLYQNQYDEHFEVWSKGLAALSSDYDFSTLDFAPHLAQHWQSVNLDNVPFSLLTHDGETLNERGHDFVALHLFEACHLEGPVESYPNRISAELFLAERARERNKIEVPVWSVT